MDTIPPRPSPVSNNASGVPPPGSARRILQCDVGWTKSVTSMAFGIRDSVLNVPRTTFAIEAPCIQCRWWWFACPKINFHLCLSLVVLALVGLRVRAEKRAIEVDRCNICRIERYCTYNKRMRGSRLKKNWKNRDISRAVEPEPHSLSLLDPDPGGGKVRKKLKN